MEVLDEALRIVGVVLGLLLTAFGIIKVWKEATAASGTAHLSALQAAAKEWREIKDDYRDRLEAMEQQAKDQDAEYTSTFESQQRQIDTLSKSVESLKATEGRLVGWVGRLHKGIGEGSIPPLPEIPSWLVALLRKANDEG